MDYRFPWIIDFHGLQISMDHFRRSVRQRQNENAESMEIQFRLMKNPRTEPFAQNDQTCKNFEGRREKFPTYMEYFLGPLLNILMVPVFALIISVCRSCRHR